MNSTRPQLDSKLKEFLKGARWFQQKGSPIASVELVDRTEANRGWRLCVYRISFEDVAPELYLILSNAAGSEFLEIDDADFLKSCFEKFENGGDIKTEDGRISFRKFGDWRLDSGGVAFEAFPGVSSNSLVIRKYKGRPECIVKFVRRLQKGRNVEAEINGHLFEAGPFEGAPAFRAYATYVDGSGDEYHVASLFDYVENEGSAWDWTLKWLKGFIDDGFVDAGIQPFGDRLFKLGALLGSLHIVLSKEDAGFGVRPVDEADLYVWREGWLAQADRSFGFMKRSKVSSGELAEVLSREKEIRSFFENAGAHFTKLGAKIRQHGDFHLGQVLVGGDCFYIIDFEGEPLKAYGERAIHYPALKDVAGVMRSFNYAAFSAFFDARKRYSDAKLLGRIKSACRDWEGRAKESFLAGYYAKLKSADAKFLPLDDRGAVDGVLRTLMMDKALYEVQYEINNRPDWLPIPLGGILDALEG